MSASPINFPVYIFVDNVLACQCTRADAPARLEAYKKLFPKKKVEAFSALMAKRAGKSIPNTRRTNTRDIPSTVSPTRSEEST